MRSLMFNVHGYNRVFFTVRFSIKDIKEFTSLKNNYVIL